MKANRGNSNGGGYNNGPANTASKKPNFRPSIKNSGRNRNDGTAGAKGLNDKNLVSLFNLNDEQANQHMNDRFHFLLIKSIGVQAIATVSSGARYKGTISALDTSNSSLSVVLTNTELFESILGGNNDKKENISPELIIESKDLMDLELLNVDVSNRPPTPASASASASPAPKPASDIPAKSGFRTDTDISGNLQVKERDLQRWTPDEGTSDKMLLLDGGLEDDLGSSGGAWDQFAVNEKKFGVQSSWDENLYTTRLDKNAPDYLEKLKEADRIAREIEKQGYNGNIHLAEERGIAVDDSGMDEEDKYSGVDRRGSELMAALRGGLSSGNASVAINQKNELPSINNGKYIPPKQRTEVHNLDPAIISSMRQNLGKSSTSPKPGAKSAAKSSGAISGTPLDKLFQPTASKEEAQTALQKEMASQNEFPAKKGEKAEETPVKDASRHHHHHHTHHNHEDSKTSKSKFRSDDRLSARQEINSLREFAANFKIPQKFPTDLLPILTKDKRKQEEIIKRANANIAESDAKGNAAENFTPASPVVPAATSVTSVNSTPVKNVSADGPSKTAPSAVQPPAETEKPKKVDLPPKPSAPSSSSKNSPALRGLSVQSSAVTSPKPAAHNVHKPSQQTPTQPRKKLDPRAPAFKLNPAAASFTPSGSPLKAFTKIGSPARQNVNLYNNNGGRHKRNYISQQSFGPKFPRAESSKKTLDDDVFNFVLQSSDPIEKSFQTPPTWGSTINESHKTLFPADAPLPAAGSIPRGTGPGGYYGMHGGMNSNVHSPNMNGANYMMSGMGNPFNPTAAAAAGSMPSIPGMMPMMNQLPDPMFAAQFSQGNPMMNSYGYNVPPQFAAQMQFNRPYGMPGAPMMPMDPMALAAAGGFNNGRGSFQGGQNGGYVNPDGGYYGSPNMRHHNNGGPNMSPQVNYGKFN